MAKRLTDADKEKINEVYYLVKNYAETARQTGFSVASVKKYILPNYQPKNLIKTKQFYLNEIPPQINVVPFVNSDNWGEFCIYTEEERNELEELWKEMII